MSCYMTVRCACHECVALSNRSRLDEAMEVDRRRYSDKAIAHRWQNSAFYWARLLDLAVAHGWEPAGTEAYPDWWDQYHDEPRPWDGSYSYGVGQWITPADGRALADAIDAGLTTAADDEAARVADAQWEAFLGLPARSRAPSPVSVKGAQRGRDVVVQLTKANRDLARAVAVSQTAAFEASPSSPPLERPAPPLADLFGGNRTAHVRQLVPPGAKLRTDHYVP
jgi:hypothetical protein